MNPAVGGPDNPHGRVLATVCDRQNSHENFRLWCLSGLKFLRNFLKIICGLVSDLHWNQAVSCEVSSARKFNFVCAPDGFICIRTVRLFFKAVGNFYCDLL